MKKKLLTHSGILSIVAGLLILAVSIPGYFTSAASSAEPAVPAVQPRELLTTSVNTPRTSVTRAESLEPLRAVSADKNAGETVPAPPVYLDVTSDFIRSGDELLDQPAVPDQIEIPAVELSASVITAEHTFTEVEGANFGQWLAPDFEAAGWHPDSALLGEAGNTVINGHHNVHGEVFGSLVNVEEGDLIRVHSRGRVYEYIVTNRLIVPETFMDAATRLDNARWLARSDDVRLTLVTCWPKESYTHRLILVAAPVH